MTTSVRILEGDDDFRTQLATNGQKLIICDFNADWCAPCKVMKPFFKSMSDKYPLALFLEADVEKCPDVALEEGVNGLPTFIFYKKGQRIDTFMGADQASLETKIKEHYDKEKEARKIAHVSLNEEINKSQIEILNNTEGGSLEGIFVDEGSILKSDVDEQLIISVTFNQTVRLHSFIIKAPAEKGPKEMKVFINQTSTPSFEEAEKNQPIQVFKLTPDHLKGSPILTKYVLYQSVNNIVLFVKNNQTENRLTIIKYIQFNGQVVPTTNMNDLKQEKGKQEIKT